MKGLRCALQGERDTHMTEEQEGKEEGQASPHPRLETL